MTEIIINYEDVLATYKAKAAGIKAMACYKNWFPIRATAQLAGIIADLMGDGHLQDAPKLRMDYTSKSMEELRRFDEEIFSIFKIRGRIRKCNTNKYNTHNLGINNKPLARVLRLAGVPTGCKVKTKFNIPNWILDNPSCFSRFVNRLFSCEGTVDIKSKCLDIKMYKSLELKENAMDFFKEIKDNLEKYFQIRTTNPFPDKKYTVRKDGVKVSGMRMKIKEKNSLRNFKKYIGIDNKDKKEKLNRIITKTIK